MPIRFVFIYIFLATQISLSGQQDYKFRHINISNGLSNNTVRVIFQDSKGYMWFGSDDGLNRYDAYRFISLRNKIHDSTSLPHNYINAINEDKQGNILIGTGQGVVSYNDAYGLKKLFYSRYHQKKVQTFSSNVLSIDVRSDGLILLSTYEAGLLKAYSGETIFKQVPFFNGKEMEISYSLQAVTIDAQQVWVYIENRGIAKFDEKADVISLVQDLDGVGTVNKMVTDKNGNLWLGSTNGLYKYSLKEKRVIKRWFQSPGQLSANYVSGLTFDNDNNLWIALQGGGVNVLNTDTESLRYFTSGEQSGSLSNRNATTVFIDSEGRKWIGTLNGGVNVMDDILNRFISVTHQPHDNNTLAGNTVTAIAEDGDFLWFGTDGFGISLWDRKNNNFTNYNHFVNNTITNICRDKMGNLWVATFGGGIYQFNKKTRSYHRYSCFNPVTAKENTIILRIYQDRRGDIWATTFQDGRLYKLNSATNSFEVFDQSIGDMFSLYEDSEGMFWGGNNKLIKIDRDNKKHQSIDIAKTVRTIFEDRNLNLWIGTEGGGLLLIDKKDLKVLARYTESEGLSNNSVLNILEDNQGDLWMSTFNGLSRFNPQKKKFLTYYESDGLLSNQFTYRAALKLQNGELAFGSIAGLNIFNPADLKYRNRMPPLIITSIRINNISLSENKHTKIKTSGGQIQNITIPHDQAFLSFDFAALDYSTPDKIRYAYLLEGWDKSWNFSKNRSVTYNNIREGDYTLRIKSTNAEGDWNPKETLLKITILPPWYRSVWAYLFYLLATFSVIYFYLRYLTNKQKLEYEIKLAKQTVENEKELSERKATFFTNISHEFRTLLTLIINPINELMQKEDEEKPMEVQIAYNNSRRMLGLVDQLLLFRKVNANQSDINIAPYKIYDLCREVFDSFQYQSKSKKLEYSLTCDEEDTILYVDAEKIEIAVFNLLSNAIKYAPQEGFVKLEIKNSIQEVEISITDNGNGFSDKVGDKIFNPYYQVKTLESKSKPGFGIGLNIVKNFIDIHKGKISYKTETGKGTTFIINLLKGKHHFPESVLRVEKEKRDQLAKEVMMANIGAKTNFSEDLQDEIISTKKSLLVIDDDEELCLYIKSIFSNSYDVTIVLNGNEAFELASKMVPDVIITDLNLIGGLNGDELCIKLKADPKLKHIPVIMITGNESPETRLRCIETGADDYIIKPFDKALLKAKVANFVASKTNLQQYFLNHVTLKNEKPEISEEERAFLDLCVKVVEEHLFDDQFAVISLAKEMGMSHSSLYKKIKQLSGHSINSFVRMIRLRKAALLLINTNSNVNQVAFDTGFKDLKHFRAQFSKLFHCTPSEYIKKYRTSFQGNFRMKQNSKREKS